MSLDCHILANFCHCALHGPNLDNVDTVFSWGWGKGAYLGGSAQQKQVFGERVQEGAAFWVLSPPTQHSLEYGRAAQKRLQKCLLEGNAAEQTST